jgi:pimeloyl-ACP methyl ester carboxylesterase
VDSTPRPDPHREPDLHVEVEGGRLAVHRLAEGAGPVVLAVHGITANGLAWGALARRLDGVATVWAPDLRGRAASRDVAGPYGVGQHADDLVAVLDAVGVERAVVVGHSMGAFVTAVLAARHPERVVSAVLVDGGFAFPRPPGTSGDDVDALIGAVIGPALQRLSMTFAGLDDYLAFFGRHPAVGPVLRGTEGDLVRAYLAHDLVGDGATWRSSCVLDAVRTDGGGLMLDPDVQGAAAAAATSGVPVRFLWAERGLLDEPQGLYDADRVAALDLPDAVQVEHVPGTNHYSVVLDRPGVEAVARSVSSFS